MFITTTWLKNIKRTKIKFILWPFAVSPSFSKNIKDKIYDIGFLILKNTNHAQLDLRYKVMNKMFYTFGTSIKKRI